MKKIITAVVVLVALTACSSNNNDEPTETKASEVTTSTPAPKPVDTSEKDLKKNVNDYSDAFLSGEGIKAYDLLTQKCQDSMAKAEFLDMTVQARDYYGTLPIKSYKANIDGNVATVTYTYSNPEINQTDEQWIKQAGTWKNDDC